MMHNPALAPDYARTIQSGMVTINGRDILADPEIPEAAASVLKCLFSGHQDDKLRYYKD
jgi:hypothetical protein